MAKYLVEGGNKLSGKVEISGNKNSILPCLAACLLTDEEVVLRNVPNIVDVEVFVKLLRSLGAEVDEGDHLVKVRCKNIKNSILPEELVSKLRASLLLVGPLLSRIGKVEFLHPGGDVIGKRSIATHLKAFERLGFSFRCADRSYKGSYSKKPKGNSIFLNEASVTATENILLASALCEDTTVVKNAAEEPHVVDLCNLLVKMGVNIEGIGTSTVKITGAKKLKTADFTIGADPIEFGTYAIAAVVTGGGVEISKNLLPDLDPIINPLKLIGVNFHDDGEILRVTSEKLVSVPKLVINIWPGFPTDLMSVAIVLVTQARGVTLCHDWMYESRMFFVDKLIAMGANITIADPHRVLVYGPSKLHGRVLETPDIRAGMALVLAALSAKGESVINRAELIERGYENVVSKLVSLGAKIERSD